jgi:hypothetical protein
MTTAEAMALQPGAPVLIHRAALAVGSPHLTGWVPAFAVGWHARLSGVLTDYQGGWHVLPSSLRHPTPEELLTLSIGDFARGL